jgi:hypothetical protein
MGMRAEGGSGKLSRRHSGLLQSRTQKRLQSHRDRFLARDKREATERVFSARSDRHPTPNFFLEKEEIDEYTLVE